jgi:ketosteroid isomerase-like protein
MTENVATLEALYDAINRSDVEGILRYQADDVEWRGPLPFPDLSGAHRGHDGVRTYAKRIHDAWEEFSVIPERFVDLGDRVLVLTRERGRGRLSGIEVHSQPTAHIWTLRDGVVISFEVFWDREEGLQAAGVRLRAARRGRLSRASFPDSVRSAVP